MKRSLLILAMSPLFSPAAEPTLANNLRGLPEDFRRYFYHAEVLVQVYLNDSMLFNATAVLQENGDIRLIRIFDENPALASSIRAQWFAILQRGVTVGQCRKTCPAGLMAAEYRLSHSELKLYTSQYETSQVRRDFIAMPPDTADGMIMSSDLSVTDTPALRSWGLNTSLLASFAGWSQKASFQSSGTDGDYRYRSASLYELFSQKELPGSFIRLGFFTPDSDTGNVQASGFGDDTVAGVMWGTSDALLESRDSVSARPVYVTGRSQSLAEVWLSTRPGPAAICMHNTAACSAPHRLAAISARCW
ncbi:hypothetical protein [Erwinia sp. V71]|uniref:hypothetical protein n=1 Tax=Erwinia sp. V71 TaxID=3369424 RepID=UPI003F60A919